ncbi:MAG TPA: hypothetical protein VGG33_21835 [Polyangia bacterium]
MSFPALRNIAPAPRSEMSSSYASNDKAAKVDDSKANAPTRLPRTDSRSITRSTLPIVLEPHWESSIDSATD